MDIIYEELFTTRSCPMIIKEEFVRLAQTNMDAVFRLAYSYLKNRSDADDITQIVLLRLLETNTVFENDAHVKNWLLCVAANECKKHWRSPWSKVECLDDYSDTLTFEEPQYSDLFQAIMDLEQKYRVVIVLYYYEGYAIKEIAKILRIPQGTVGTRLSRARDQLKQYLQGE